MAVIGNALTTLALRANIYVTTRAGATVRFIKGGVTMATLTADSGGHCNYEILIPNFGSWTVTSTTGSASGSSTVTVSDTIQYNVAVAQRLYLIQNGNFTVAGHTVVGPVRAAFSSDYGNYVWLTTDIHEQLDSNFVSGYFTDGIGMDYYNTLNIYSKQRGDGAYAGIVTSTSEQEAVFTNSVQLCGIIKDYDTKSTKSLDISGVTGTKYVALRAKSWMYWDSGGTTGSPGEIMIWDLWLQG